MNNWLGLLFFRLPYWVLSCRNGWLVGWFDVNILSFLIYRLVELLQDYSKVVDDIPEIILPLMKPFINTVEDTIKPGLTMLSWTSLNIEACKYSAAGQVTHGALHRIFIENFVVESDSCCLRPIFV